MDPVFSSEDASSRLTWQPSRAFLRYSINALLAGSLSFLCIVFVFTPGQSFRAIGPGIVALVACVAWLLLVRGRIRDTLNVLAYGSWLALTGIGVFNGGVRTTAVVAYPVIIMMIGWLIGARAAMIAAVLTVIATLGFIAAEAVGVLPQQPPTPASMYGVVQIVIFFISAALMNFLSSAYLAKLREIGKVGRELVQRNLEVEASRSDLNHAQSVAGVGSWVYDLVGDAMHLSTETCRIFGLPQGSIGNRDSYLRRAHPDDRDAVDAAWSAALKSGSFDYEHRIVIAKTIRWVRQRADFEFGPDGTAVRAVGVSQDITERKSAQEEIRRLAFYDPLTSLPNRRLLQDRLEHALASSCRSDKKLAVLFIDLDNFKTLNDILGHHFGDLLLRQVAQRLSSCVREADTVARLGGDEFVIILQELDCSPDVAASQAESIGEKVIAALTPTYSLEGQECRSTPSIGIAIGNGHEVSLDDLMKRADLAMYQAKAAGRNTLRFFDPKMQAAVAARASLEAELRTGIKQAQLALYYQPQVDSDGTVTGSEALVRWIHPQRGLVQPGEFIALAEDTGLILPLGRWVLETACEQLTAWSRQPGRASLSLAVNVSAHQFRQVDFFDQVKSILEASGANPAMLKLEVTESVLLTDVEGIIDKMSAIKALGVSFSLDDFGTGYSSLSYLKRLPLDQLKIDQSFVRDVLIDANDAAIARTIVALAHSLSLTVVAEGVETQEQRLFLADAGCLHYQGYLFGRPMPIEDFDHLVGTPPRM